MKRKSRKKTRGEVARLRNWTHTQAEAARPYLASILQSMRETFLEAIRCYNQVQKLSNRPGHADRATLIALEEAQHAFAAARDRFEDTEVELNQLDVYSLDPVQGLGMIPFIHDKQLAWFVFDLFDPQPLRFWRFHEDPLDQRRPVQSI